MSEYLEKMVVQISTDTGDIGNTIKMLKELKHMSRGSGSSKLKESIKDAVKEDVKDSLGDPTKGGKTNDMRRAVRAVDTILFEFKKYMNNVFGSKTNELRTSLIRTERVTGASMIDFMNKMTDPSDVDVRKSLLTKVSHKLYGDTEHIEEASMHMKQAWLNIFRMAITPGKMTAPVKEVVKQLMTFDPDIKDPTKRLGINMAVLDALEKTARPTEWELQQRIAANMEAGSKELSGVRGTRAMQEFSIVALSNTEEAREKYKQLLEATDPKLLEAIHLPKEFPTGLPLLPMTKERMKRMKGTGDIEFAGTTIETDKLIDLVKGSDSPLWLNYKKLMEGLRDLKIIGGRVDIFGAKFNMKGKDDDETKKLVIEKLFPTLKFGDEERERMMKGIHLTPLTGKEEGKVSVQTPLLELATQLDALKVLGDAGKRYMAGATDILHVAYNVSENAEHARNLLEKAFKGLNSIIAEDKTHWEEIKEALNPKEFMNRYQELLNDIGSKMQEVIRGTELGTSANPTEYRERVDRIAQELNDIILESIGGATSLEGG